MLLCTDSEIKSCLLMVSQYHTGETVYVFMVMIYFPSRLQNIYHLAKNLQFACSWMNPYSFSGLHWIFFTPINYKFNW